VAARLERDGGVKQLHPEVREHLHFLLRKGHAGAGEQGEASRCFSGFGWAEGALIGSDQDDTYIPKRR